MFANQQESQFFLSHIQPHHKVLEYGSGDSTVQIAHLASKVVSVEHQQHWFNTISTRLRYSDNVELILKLPNLPFQENKEDGDYNTFKDYIEAPLEKFPFDIILIDGRARAECAEFVSKYCNIDTLVFIHDYGTNEPTRQKYTNVLQWFDIIKFIDTMYLFKKKH